MWLIVTTGSDDFFQFFHVVVGSCVLCHDTGFSLGAADVGCPHRKAPTPVHPNRPITAQDTSMGLAHANCSSSADAGHKLHINRSLEAFSTPSRCDLVTRTEAPTLRPPQKITLTQDESPTQKPESTLNSKSCHEDKFLFRYKYAV